jgi:pimeloyl-ACP methyl ester carboxylesterase
VLHVERVSSVILARPAWVSGPSPKTQGAYREVAELLEKHGPEKGAALFEMSPTLAAVELQSPDNAKSLRWFFTRPTPAGTVALLSKISNDSPGVTLAEIRGITVRALIIANDQDYVHPLSYAKELAGILRKAELSIIVSKSVDRTRHVEEFRQALSAFLAGSARQ